MKRLFTILLLFLSVGSLMAQSEKITVSGTVISGDDKMTLPGVTVLVKGTMIGTTTNIDGLYALKDVPSDGVLVFSFVGMQSQEVPVNGNATIDVTMSTESFGLDEVVVIGYGTVKKKDVTGAVSVVDSKTIENLKPVKVEEALQGTVSGVNITPQSGAPGSGFNIRIRGVSTNGDPSPVVFIDGYLGDLNTLNPNDIESMTVLKDAQASIYGTVGANGVILITTKKGRKNSPTSVTINSSYGLQEATRKLPVLNATEYGVLLNESYAAAGDDLPYPDVSQLGEGTDWQEELFQVAPISDQSINISGGSDKTVYTISGSDLRQQGIIGEDKTGYKRTTGRVSVGSDLSSWLKFNSAVSYSYIRSKSLNTFGLGSVLFNAVNMPSTYPIYNADGSYYLVPSDVGNEIINPFHQMANTYNDYNIGKLTANASLEAKFAQHFTATARIGTNRSDAQNKSFSKEVYYGYDGKVFNNSRNSVTQNTDFFFDYSFDAFVTYDNTFANAHHITGTFGNTVYNYNESHLYATGLDVPYNSYEFADIALANGDSETKLTNSWYGDHRRLSYFTRLQYDYQGKYLFSAMIRRDASTRFSPDNAVAWFPSATLGWIVSDEGFMENADKINMLKLRMSYGVLGSDKIGDFRYISTLDGEGVYIFDNSLTYGTAIGALPNTDVRWEQSHQFDIGFDLKLMNDKIDFNADYFIKTTEDLLIPDIPVTGILGTSAPGAGRPTLNAGTVRNSGFEFAVGYRGSIKENLVFRTNYTFTYIKNEVLEVNNGTGIFEGGSFGVGQPYPSRMEVGFPIGYFYGYQTDGIFQSQAEVDAHPSQVALGSEASPGDIRFVDVNGDGVIDADDRTNIGDPIPDFVMGLNLTFEYKGFDLITYIYSSIGNDIVRNYERVQPNVNRMSYWLDRWTGPGTSDEVPRVTTDATSNTVFSDFYVEDGSYVRIQRMQLGYKLPKDFIEKFGLKELRFYFSVNNLVTFTKYKGFDPASSTGTPIGGGFDGGFYPAARIYTFGLNLNI